MTANALIISNSNKSAGVFSEMLNSAKINNISVLHSAGEARRILLEKEFDIVIVDAPLPDESGENVSRYIASKDLSQVIYAVNNEHFYAAASVCADDGVLTISKPVNTEFFWAALALAKAAGNKIKKMQAENAKLKQKIEDIRIIDRAKCLLISYLNLSENEAHRFIEKQAMDLRSTKRAISEEILRTYAN